MVVEIDEDLCLLTTLAMYLVSAGSNRLPRDPIL